MLQHIEPCVRKRHRHRDGYAALVLSGKYEETGDTGRWEVAEGDVVYHRPFEAHANLIPTACTVINIPAPPFVRLPPVFRVACSDDLHRLAKAGSPEASDLLIPNEIRQPKIADWCDRLAMDLQNQPIRLRNWSSENGLRVETLSRRFKRIYGVSPARYRIEAQTRLALDLIINHVATLTEIAVTVGFADQAHMSRAVKTLTGRSPAAWRTVKSVQDSSPGVA